MCEEALCIDRAETGERKGGKGGIRAEIVSRTRVPVGEIAAAVPGGEKLPADPLLPLQQQDVPARDFCRGQRGDHAGCAAADDGDGRITLTHR